MKTTKLETIIELHKNAEVARAMGMKITVDQIMGWGPCPEYPRERVEGLIGDGKTVDELLELEIPINDRVWGVCHAIPVESAVACAIACAERVLLVFEAERPGDDRPGQWIEAAQSYAVYASYAAARASDASDAAYAVSYAADAAVYAGRAAKDAGWVLELLKKFRC